MPLGGDILAAVLGQAKLLVFKDVPLLNRNSLNCANSDPRQLTECAISVEQAQSDVKEATEMLDVQLDKLLLGSQSTEVCQGFRHVP